MDNLPNTDGKPLRLTTKRREVLISILAEHSTYSNLDGIERKEIEEILVDLHSENK